MSKPDKFEKLTWEDPDPVVVRADKDGATLKEFLGIKSKDELVDLFLDMVRVMPESSLTVVEQLSWAIDLHLEDSNGLCDAIHPDSLKQLGNKKDWSAVADAYRKRLNKLPRPNSDEDSFSRKYARDQLSRWVAVALEFADREDDLLDLYVAEAQINGSWTRLVEHLIFVKHWDDAKHHCLEGIRWCVGQPKQHGGALYGKLEEIYEQTGDLMALAASLGDEFFSGPTESRYFGLIKTARKLKLGKPVAALARWFLETGEEAPPAGKSVASGTVWPLPPPEAPQRDRGFRRGQPRFDVLLDIAIREKKPDEVIKWYDAENRRDDRRSYGAVLPDARVAHAVRRKYPDRAIRIWKALALGQINQINVRGYEAAVPHIREIRDLLLEQGKEMEWEEYIAKLKAENRRRPRCLEIMERIAVRDKRIID